MGIETIAIIGLVVAAAGGAFAIQQAQETANAASQAAEANLRGAETEAARQRKEVDRISQEEKTDVVRRADAELGAILAVEGEFGASPSTFSRLVQEVSFLEGIDLSRTDSNRESRLGAIDAGVEAARQGATNSITFARNAERAAITKGILGFVGSGLQIGAGVEARNFEISQAKNPAPKGS